MIEFAQVDQASARLAKHVRCTPVTFDSQRQWYFKWENNQITGSFKLRGALNKVLLLEPQIAALGLVAASTGNHGQGVAFAGQLLGAPVLVFASEHAIPAKLAAMRDLGAQVTLVAGGYEQAELTGLQYAREHGLSWVSPYNDVDVIAGQGTLLLEMQHQMPLDEIGIVAVPVGGGGLISGIGVAMQRLTHHPRLVGVQPVASAFMHALYYQGTQKDVLELPSLADGLSGAVEDGAMTIDLVRSMVDELVLVSEEEISSAIAFAFNQYQQIIEGSAAVTLAAALAGKLPADKPLALVLSGGNLQPDVLKDICARSAGIFA